MLAKLQSVCESKLKSNYDTELYYSTGCILGAFLGDALGSYCEFKFGSEVLFDEKVVFKEINPVWNTNPGQITDDSEMALSLGYGLMDSIGAEPNFNKVAYNYGYWYFSIPYDIGTTTINAMKTVGIPSTYESIKLYYSPELKVDMENYNYFDEIYWQGFVSRVNKVNKTSCSNGFMMRKTPLAVYCMRYCRSNRAESVKDDHIIDMKGLKTASVDDTRLTHSHPNTHKGAEIYSILITRIIYLKTYFPEYKEVGTNTINYLKTFIENEFSGRELTVDMKNILSLINNGKPWSLEFTYRQFRQNMCWFMLGLLLAIKYLNTIDNSDITYYQIMKEVINYGGDTDTNAAIVGGVIGAYFGPEYLEDSKLKIMLKFNPYKNGLRSRPSIYSPGFGMLQAERIISSRRDQVNKNSELETGLTYENHLPIAISTLLHFVASE